VQGTVVVWVEEEFEEFCVAGRMGGGVLVHIGVGGIRCVSSFYNHPGFS